MKLLPLLLLLLVACSPGTLNFNVQQLPNGIVGQPYQFSFCNPVPTDQGLCGADRQVNPAGGDPPYTFAMGFGFPPFGLNLQLNGVLKGTPTAEGERDFEICTQDRSATSTCRTVTLRIGPVQAAPPPPVPKEKRPEPE